MPRPFLCGFILLLAATLSHAREFGDDFAVVMIDDATEAKLGAFPYDRVEYAKAVEACARLHAKAIVLKFFFDEPKSTAGDAALAAAMKKILVLVQARLLEDTDGVPQELPAKFRYAGGGVPRAAIRGNFGWLPFPRLLENAAGVGFVDFASGEIPLIEEYRGAPYKSLIVGCLELTTGETARIVANRRMEFGSKFLPVDQANVYHAVLDPHEKFETISFVSLLDGNVDATKIADHVVIIGWDSSKTTTLPTPYGPTRIHRIFLQCLAAAWHGLTLTSPQTPPAPP